MKFSHRKTKLRFHITKLRYSITISNRITKLRYPITRLGYGITNLSQGITILRHRIMLCMKGMEKYHKAVWTFHRIALFFILKLYDERKYLISYFALCVHARQPPTIFKILYARQFFRCLLPHPF